MREADQVDASEINWVDLPGDDEDDDDDRNIDQSDDQKHDDDQHSLEDGILKTKKKKKRSTWPSSVSPRPDFPPNSDSARKLSRTQCSRGYKVILW